LETAPTPTIVAQTAAMAVRRKLFRQDCFSERM
jgi:hypothetical protein